MELIDRPFWFRIQAEFYYQLIEMVETAAQIKAHRALRDWLVDECQCQATRLFFWRSHEFGERI